MQVCEERLIKAGTVSEGVNEYMYIHVYVLDNNTVDREIFVVKIFSWLFSTTKI